VCWAPDASGFFYIVPGAPAAGAAADAPRVGKRVLYHALGRPAGEDRLIQAFGAEARWVYCMTSADGRYALFVAEEGVESEFVALALGDRRPPEVTATPFPLLAGQHAFPDQQVAGFQQYLTTFEALYEIDFLPGVRRKRAGRTQRTFSTGNFHRTDCSGSSRVH